MEDDADEFSRPNDSGLTLFEVDRVNLTNGDIQA